jgi:hypothetical protein
MDTGIAWHPYIFVYIYIYIYIYIIWCLGAEEMLMYTGYVIVRVCYSKGCHGILVYRRNQKCRGEETWEYGMLLYKES